MISLPFVLFVFRNFDFDSIDLCSELSPWMHTMPTVSADERKKTLTKGINFMNLCKVIKKSVLSIRSLCALNDFKFDR